jgi:hypothetical protein
MKKNRPYQFVFAGKLLEHDSLIDLKSEIPDEEWQMMVGMTAELWMQMEALSKTSELSLESKDRKTMRALKRSLKFIEKLDPVTYTRFCTDKLRKYFDDTVSGELSKLEAAQPKPQKPGSGLDISVSEL